MRRLLLPLLAPSLVVVVVDGIVQNLCGDGWAGAIKCEAYCPGGSDSECPGGQQCFADVPDCPIPPTISPKPTRMPVPTFPVGTHQKQIVGYYASWQWYDRGKLAKPSNMDFTKVTRVNFAFFQLDEEGNIWGTDEWADPRLLYGNVDGEGEECSPGLPGCKCSWVKPQFKSCMYHDETDGLIWQVHQARAEIYPSIGGWTLSDAFPPMSADPVSRKIFARNCAQLIEDYDFDGIDLDWEYPGYAAHSGTTADTQNFNLLLKDIRDELDALTAKTGRNYGLTAALPCGPANIANIEIMEVRNYLTEFNLMSYDFHGAWDQYTGVNSPLWDQSTDPEPGWSVDGCVRNWVERGAPKDKLNIGLAFYGRSFRDATSLGVAHGGADDFAWEVDEGTPQYFNIIKQIHDMTVGWDEETATPYAYFNDMKGGVVSYDDERAICMKTNYVIEEGLLGFIIWELSGDVMDDLYTPLLDVLNRKLSVTRTNCADPLGPLLDTEPVVKPPVPPVNVAPAPPVVAPVPALHTPPLHTPPEPAIAPLSDIESSYNPPDPAATQSEPAVVLHSEPAFAPVPDIESSYIPPDPAAAQPEPAVVAPSEPVFAPISDITASYTPPDPAVAPPEPAVAPPEPVAAPEPPETTTKATELLTTTSATTTILATTTTTTTSTTKMTTPGSVIMMQSTGVSGTAQAVSSAMDSMESFSSSASDGRQRVQRNTNKPEKPYRPSKEERSEL